MGGVDYRLLGTLEALRGDGSQIALGGAKQRAVLAMLLLSANRVVTTEGLVEALWPEQPPGKPQTAVQGYVSHLRKALDADKPFDVITTEPAGYRLPLDPEQLDLFRLESRLRGGREALDADEPEIAAKAFREALELFRGPPLADFTYESWAQNEIGRLAELQLVCIEERIDAEMRLGRHAELVGELEALIGEHPLRERLRALHMLALYRAGRQSEALAAYQEARATLVEKFGIEPARALQELERNILLQDPTLDLDRPAEPAALPRQQAPGGSETTLPSPASTFLGRERELEELEVLLASPKTRVLTLTGPGGVGKTRLALQSAARAHKYFADGVMWVSLSPLRDPTLVLEAVSHALNAANGLDTQIGTQKLLLCLDNLEQVIDSAAELASLSNACPNLTLLVTSRELLRVTGEVEYVVPPLATAEAVSLFCNRSGLEPSDEIADLCGQLDNLPLAVELGAARTKALTPAQIAARLSSRLDLLQGGRDADPRQQTLRAAIEWSHDLLSREEQQLLRRLSVFVGGCALEAAETVCDAGVDPLQSLVEKSLLRFSDTRYWMLETIREYASESLRTTDEVERIRRGHAAWFSDLARTAAGASRDERSIGLQRFEQEHDNIRAALEWYLAAGEDDRGAALALDLSDFWLTRGHLREGRQWLDLWLERGLLSTERRIQVLHEASSIAIRQGDDDAIDRLASALLEAANDADDDRLVVQSLAKLAWTALRREDFERAAELQRAASERARGTADKRALLVALTSLGLFELRSGRVSEARTALLESLELARQAAEKSEAVATGVFNLGLVEVAACAYDDAARWLLQAISLYEDLGDREGIAYCLSVTASIAVARDDHAAAVRLLGVSSALLAAVGASLEPVEDRLRADAELAARASLSSSAFEELFREGASVDLETAGDLGKEELAPTGAPT